MSHVLYQCTVTKSIYVVSHSIVSQTRKYLCFIPDNGDIIFSPLKKMINSYFDQWVFSPRGPLVKQALLYLFAFNLYLKVYVCASVLQASVAVV